MPNQQPVPAAISEVDRGPLADYFCTLKFYKYERPEPFKPSDAKHIYQLALPLPTQLMEDTKTDWQTTNMNTVGDIVNGDIAGGVGAIGLRYAGNAISSEAGIAGNFIGGAVAKKFGASAANVGAAGEAVGAGLEQVLPPEQISTAIQQGLGVAPNPNQTVFFQGPTLREFNFSWTIYPISAEHSRHMQRVFKLLRKYTLPEAAFGRSASILTYPHLCQMNFYPWDGKGTQIPGAESYGWTTESIIKLKKGVIPSINVNYAPGNIPAFFEGTQLPTVIQISLTYKEVEYMMAHDYDDRFLEDQPSVKRNIANALGLGDLAEAIGIE